MNPPTTNGPINAVTCPNCGKRNDMRDLQEQQLLDTGSTVGCDHCNNLMDIVSIQPVTIVTVRKSSQRPTRQRTVAAKQSTTLSPAQTRKLLGNR